MERRLAAIVCADVAGYSRMMGADEAGTHAAFKAHRSAIYPIILNHGGRLVKNTGDGFLLEFPSIVGAIEAAIAMQTLMAERNHHLPADRVMQFRMGVHMGDVIADEDEVFGDDVNIAVRLESVAAPAASRFPTRPTPRPASISASPWSTPAATASRTSRNRSMSGPGSPAGSGRAATASREAIEPAGAIPDRDRGRAALRQSQRQRRRIFLRRTDRGPDPRAVAAIVLSGAEPQLDLRVQGQEPEHPPDRARDRRDLPDPGLGAARRNQDPRHRRTDRAGERRAIMDRPL